MKLLVCKLIGVVFSFKSINPLRLFNSFSSSFSITERVINLSAESSRI
ncbi:MAG: hypothetical protein E7D28_10955 [Clostridium sp.]|nr:MULTISPECIES: hypothetical protein [Clostridium]MDB1955943.1 hypothetical protein [Clostridium tertium]MDB1959399.1 hypothetical protein [Clostridium tertium]MDB1963290.1 hypothetical protein [Clostridium tertium]MDB1967088.1 hypothetical protein [Clostridium tertium]MDU2460474.1 hypothetical protein [Clostridium sp.]